MADIGDPFCFWCQTTQHDSDCPVADLEAEIYRLRAAIQTHCDAMLAGDELADQNLYDAAALLGGDDG